MNLTFLSQSKNYKCYFTTPTNLKNIYVFKVWEVYVFFGVKITILHLKCHYSIQTNIIPLNPGVFFFLPSFVIVAATKNKLFGLNHRKEHGVWSTDGCKVAQSNYSTVTCHCSHLTSFAVITRVTKYQVKKYYNCGHCSFVCSFIRSFVRLLAYLFICRTRTHNYKRIK